MATTFDPAHIGHSIPRLEAREKVTGRAEYAHHLRLPGMLYGKIFRSTRAARAHQAHRHVSRRRASPGVLSRRHHRRRAQGHPDPYYGPAFHDQPILADGKVRFVGEPVAVVLASDPHVAEEAVAADHRRIRGAAGGLRRGRGDDLDGRSCTTS